MQRTIFGTPMLDTALRAASHAALRLAGWRVEGRLPESASRCVIIGAPHTSNWDMPVTLLAAFVLRLNPFWMGKHTIFAAPFGALMRWFGGIAVDRSQQSNLVDASAAALRAADAPMQLLIAPEGTRGKAVRWRTGFYYIALNAGVPIVFGYVDHAERRVGLGDVFVPTGDVERDLAAIRAWYAPLRARNAPQHDAG